MKTLFQFSPCFQRFKSLKTNKHFSVTGFFLLLFPLFFTSSNFGTAQEKLIIHKLSQPIIFDGNPDEPAWEKIDTLPMVMHIPNFGKPSTERTVIRISFDDTYLYFGASLYDKDPSGIRMPSMKRDENSFSNDWIGIILDTFDDKENALGFFTSPSGLRTDFTIFNDAQPKGTSFPLNFDWNTFWGAKVLRNDLGWFAEIRIPLSSLRFQEINDEVTMGMIVWRRIARKNEIISYPAIPQDWGFWSVFKPSQAKEVVFKGLKSRRPVYLAPFALAGIQQDSKLNALEDAYIKSISPKFQGGLDVKYGLTGNITLDVTVNPDFAQVEADDQQVNLTRFSLFYPEKRRFFQERSSNFDFNFGNYDRLFYTRQIGLFEGGEVPIYGGVRVVGRSGPWDIGILNMQTASVEQENLPSENFGVVRIRRRIINESTYVGGIVTSKLGMDGSFNTAYGLDGIFNLFGNDFLNIMWAQTFDSDQKNNFLSVEPAKVQVAWERRSQKGLGYNLNYSRAGSLYHPEMGFEMRSDYSRLGDRVSYGWLSGEKSRLLNHYVFLDGSFVVRNVDQSTETMTLSPGWSFQTKNGSMGTFRVTYNMESVSDTFYLSNTTYIPDGNYSFLNTALQFESPSTGSVFVSSSLSAGNFYDGKLFSFSVAPNWNLSSKLTLSATYLLNRGVFIKRDQDFTTHTAGLKILFMPSTKLSFSSFVQYNSSIQKVIANFRFRYNPKEGNDLYVVYNENLNTGRFADFPVMPLSNTRTLLLKYTYTFRLER